MSGKASLADEVRALMAESARSPRCKVGLMLDAMKAAERADLESVLADPTVHRSVIAKVLTARGWQIGESSLTRHTRGVCQCPRA